MGTAIAWSTSLYADARPDGTRALNKQEIIQYFSGKTRVWTKGGIYYAPNGTQQSTWDGSVGTGTWQADNKGNLCSTSYYWNKGYANPDKKGERCTWLRTDGNGNIWINDDTSKTNIERKNEWWRIVEDGQPQEDKLAPGNAVEKKIARAYRKNGPSKKIAGKTGGMKLIKTQDELMSLIANEKLYSRKANYAVYLEDGTYSGKWNGKKFAATWRWMGSEFCRTIIGSNKGEECQKWETNGQVFKVTKTTGKKGVGGFWYFRTNK